MERDDTQCVTTSRDTALLGKLAERQAVARAALEVALDVGAWMPVLHAASVPSLENSNNVGFTLQLPLLESNRNADSKIKT